MKIASLSTVAEVMPFYGTWDQVYKFMGRWWIKTREIFNSCRVRFGKITKRKQIPLDLDLFLEYIEFYDDDIKTILSIFEVSWVKIKEKSDYEALIEKLNKFKDIGIIWINKMEMHLSSKDNFSISYENVWTKIEYDEDDRNIDETYNNAIEKIKALELNVKSIWSFLYLEEVKNRKVKTWDRVIAFISEEMDVKSFTEHINQIRKKSISINKIWLILRFDEWINTENKYFSHLKSFINMPWKSVEVFVNSQLKLNIIAWDFFETNTYERKWRVIHLKPSDNIFEYEKYFKKDLWRLSDWHISGNKHVRIIWRNHNKNLKWWIILKSIKVNLQNDDYKEEGSTIQLLGWNQLIVEHNLQYEHHCNNEFLNKYRSSNISKIDKTWMLIDPNWIEYIWNLNRDLCNLRFKNVKHYINDSFDIYQKTDVISDLFTTKRLLHNCEIKATLDSKFNSDAYAENIQKLSKHHLEGLEINVMDEFNEEKIIDILSPILLTKKLNKFHLKMNNLKIKKKSIKKPIYSNSKLKVTIETKNKVDALSVMILKNLFPNVNFIWP